MLGIYHRVLSLHGLVVLLLLFFCLIGLIPEYDNRTEKWASVTQNVNVRAGAMYYFRIRIKLLNQFLTHQFHSTSVMMAVEYADGTRISVVDKPHTHTHAHTRSLTHSHTYVHASSTVLVTWYLR